MTRKRALWGLAALALCALAVLAVIAQQPTSPDVSILVSAKDRYDRLITNLGQEDIRIFEDGILRPITRFERADDLPRAIEVLIDTSASTKNQSASVPILAKAFLELTIRKGKDTAAITTFGRQITLMQSATDDVKQLHATIDRIVMQTAAGPTPMYSAIVDAANRLASAPGRRMVFLVTDGFDTSSPVTRGKLLETLQKKDVAVYPMYCFCAGPVPPGEPKPLTFDVATWTGMTDLAKATGGTVYLPKSMVAQEIGRDLRQLARELAGQRLVSFQPGRRKNPGSLVKIRIEAAKPELKDLKFKYRQRY